MDSRQAESLHLLAQALMGGGRFANAETILLGLIEVMPDDRFARRNLVECRLRQGKYAEAEPMAAELAASETGADLIPALFFHAHALWGSGRTEESEKVVQRYAQELANQETATK